MKKWIVIMMLLAAAAGSLSGCGSKNKETEAVTEAVTEKETEEITEAVTEKETEEIAEAVTEKETGETAADTEDNLAEISAAGPFGTFETQTLYGEVVTQEIFANADLTMINIWGTFCSPCINEMPDLGELAREYEEKGIQMIGMISDVTEANDETAVLIVEKTKADYTHLILSESLYRTLAQVQAVPTTVFVDRTGKQVGYGYTGSRSKKDWSAIMDEMLLELQK